MNLFNDIYYQTGYARLYAGPDSSLFTFEYRSKDAVLYNLSIKRPIRTIGLESCDETWYDLETPYGYGGLLTNSSDANFIKEALAAYRERCRQERIIAEFFRFHPLNNFPVKFPYTFDMLTEDREIVATNLDCSTEERWKQYSATTRNILRKAVEQLDFRPSDDLDIFEELYRQTMRKNNADDFYYFDREYFRSLYSLRGVQLYQVTYKSRVIAMAFFLMGQELAHYHLSANDVSLLKLNANYYMLDQAFEIAREKGLKTCILGGGRSSDPTDSLYRFKQKFSHDTMTFHIAGIVHSPEKYNDYVDRWKNSHADNNSPFFLKYRL